MKLYRFLYRAALICAFLYGLYSGNRFSWVLFLALTLGLLAALGINIWTAWSFSYVQELSSPEGEKGQTVGLHIGIYNDKPFPFTRMKVAVEVPDSSENQALEIDLAPHTDCSFDFQLNLPRRGEFMVGMTRLDLQDVFGLLPMHFDLRRLPYYRQKPLLVLPRVREFALPAGGIEQHTGGQSNPGPGQDEFAWLREWQAGDHLSRVHWAATAKTRTLFTRQYEDPAGGNCLIFMDCRTLPDDLADRLTEYSATLLCAHLSRGDFVRLLSGNPQTAQPEQAFSLTQLPELRQWLALLKFDQDAGNSEALAEVLATQAYSRVYVLGGDHDPDTAQLLDSLEAPWYHWTAEELPDDLPEFLYRHLGDER